LRDMLCITMPNFAMIGQAAAKISQFFWIFLVRCKNSLDD